MLLAGRVFHICNIRSLSAPLRMPKLQQFAGGRLLALCSKGVSKGTEGKPMAGSRSVWLPNPPGLLVRKGEL